MKVCLFLRVHLFGLFIEGFISKMNLFINHVSFFEWAQVKLSYSINQFLEIIHEIEEDN